MHEGPRYIIYINMEVSKVCRNSIDVLASLAHSLSL